MRKFRVLSSILLTLLVGRIAVAQASAPSTTQPVIQRGTTNRHEQFLEIARKGDIDLLFLGDSITDFWHTRGKDVWDKTFAPLKAANFGINADRTQNLLFRLQNGELEGFKAKCIVLMIGTNNIGTPEQPRNTVEDTIKGVKAVVDEIRTRQPQAKLLLLAIFPRGETAADGHRPGIKQVNTELAKWDDGKNIFFMDIGDKFLVSNGSVSAQGLQQSRNLPDSDKLPNGSISPDIMADYLHPTEKGYQIWADAIIGKVKELMAMK